jgi:hypothetical protein
MKNILFFLLLCSTLLAQHFSPYTLPVIEDPAFATNMGLVYAASPERFGGRADANFDNRAAIQASLDAYGVCFLGPNTYGLGGYIQLSSTNTLVGVPNLTRLVHLASTNLNYVDAGPSNGLLPNGGAFASDCMVSVKSYSLRPQIFNILFDANAANRRVVGATNLTDDGTYKPGTRILNLEGEGQIVSGNGFTNLAVFEGLATQGVLGSTNGATVVRLAPGIPETFFVNFSTGTNFFFTTNANWVYIPGPLFAHNTFYGPFLSQTDSRSFPQSGYRPEGTLVIAYTSPRVAVVTGTPSGYTNTLFYNRVLYRNTRITDNVFRDFRLWRTSNTDKQIAPVHSITTAGTVGTIVRWNHFFDVHGSAFYTDNGVNLELTFEHNFLSRCARMFDSSGNQYAFGPGRYGSGFWLRNVNIAYNDFLGMDYRALRFFGDFESLIYPIYNVVGNPVGENNYVYDPVFPVDWSGRSDIRTDAKFAGMTTNLVTYLESDFFPGTTNEVAQMRLFDNVRIANNKITFYTVTDNVGYNGPGEAIMCYNQPGFESLWSMSPLTLIDNTIDYWASYLNSPFIHQENKRAIYIYPEATPISGNIKIAGNVDSTGIYLAAQNATGSKNDDPLNAVLNGSFGQRIGNLTDLIGGSLTTWWSTKMTNNSLDGWYIVQPEGHNTNAMWFGGGGYFGFSSPTTNDYAFGVQNFANVRIPANQRFALSYDARNTYSTNTILHAQLFTFAGSVYGSSNSIINYTWTRYTNYFTCPTQLSEVYPTLTVSSNFVGALGLRDVALFPVDQLAPVANLYTNVSSLSNQVFSTAMQVGTGFTGTPVKGSQLLSNNIFHVYTGTAWIRVSP